jgi:ABC-type enterochelin transport system permease subunit
MEIDITLVIAFVVGLLFGFVSQAHQIIDAFVKFQKSRLPAEWHWAIDEIAAIAVRAAEQIWAGKKDASLDKLEYAKDIVRDEAARLGVTYDEQMLTALIEAKVFELLHKE